MTLNFAVVASNKPAAPEPAPPESDYPTHLKMSDGREVWVSVPKPDRIALIAPLKHEHFLPPPKDEKQFEEYIIHLSKWLATAGGTANLGATHFQQATGLYDKVHLSAGDRQASALVQFIRPKKGTNPTPWKLRIELNPRKLGPDGLKALIADISYDKTFRVARFLADAKLTRLDVAVDMVGVEVWETVSAVRPNGKTTYYVGDDGSLETILLHRPTPKPKQTYDAYGTPNKVKRNSNPLGATVAKIYDRRKERAAVLQPAPFGAAPTIRVEIVKTWNGKGPKLVKLTSLPNLFDAIAVGYVHETPPGPVGAWAAYVAARRTRNAEAAAKLTGLTIKQALAMSKAYKAPSSTLLRHKEIWPLWETGVASTGLNVWISLGELGPTDVFEGGQV